MSFWEATWGLYCMVSSLVQMLKTGKEVRPSELKMRSIRGENTTSVYLLRVLSSLDVYKQAAANANLNSGLRNPMVSFSVR